MFESELGDLRCEVADLLRELRDAPPPTQTLAYFAEGSVWSSPVDLGEVEAAVRGVLQAALDAESVALTDASLGLRSRRSSRGGPTDSTSCCDRRAACRTTAASTS